jgi:hypothetical protein
MKEMIQFHVDDSPIDPLDRRRVAHSTLDTVTGSSGVAAVDASKANLTYGHSMLATRSRSFYIFWSSLKYLNILQKSSEKDTVRLEKIKDPGRVKSLQMSYLSDNTERLAQRNSILWKRQNTRRCILAVHLSHFCPCMDASIHHATIAEFDSMRRWADGEMHASVVKGTPSQMLAFWANSVSFTLFMQMMIGTLRENLWNVSGMLGHLPRTARRTTVQTAVM